MVQNTQKATGVGMGSRDLVSWLGVWDCPESLEADRNAVCFLGRCNFRIGLPSEMGGKAKGSATRSLKKSADLRVFRNILGAA
jgi:hypothetical protein